MKVGIYDQKGELFDGLGVLLMDMDFEPVRLESLSVKAVASGPEMFIFGYEDGIERHLKKLRESLPEALILVSGIQDLESAIASSHAGATDIFGEKINLMHLSRLLSAGRDKLDKHSDESNTLEEATREVEVDSSEFEAHDPMEEAIVDAISTHAEFSHTLLMVGGSEIFFESALYSYFSGDDTGAADFVNCATLEAGQMERIAERLPRENIDTLVFLGWDALSLGLQEELVEFVDSEGGGEAVRMVFCCLGDPLALVEEERLSEKLYLKIARREVDVSEFVKPEKELAGHS